MPHVPPRNADRGGHHADVGDRPSPYPPPPRRSHQGAARSAEPAIGLGACDAGSTARAAWGLTTYAHDPDRNSCPAWYLESGGESFALAELGFIVMQIEHIGTPIHSKSFHDVYNGNFHDNGLPDHVARLRHIAARHPFVDSERVGIFGHSGGGFASTDAMLTYLDFCNVAASGAGNHDNRSYNTHCADKHQRMPTKDSAGKSDNVASAANKGYAANLKGHLILMYGDVDDNVHPANTLQQLDELSKANKSHDLDMAPNRGHGLNKPYFIRSRWDDSVTLLLREVPPDNDKVTPPDRSTGTDAEPE